MNYLRNLKPNKIIEKINKKSVNKWALASSSIGGKQQQQQQQPHQPTQRRVDGKYAAGQECKFGVACNDPKCRGIMTHKDKDGGMQKVCRFGHGCRDKEKG